MTHYGTSTNTHASDLSVLSSCKMNLRLPRYYVNNVKQNIKILYASITVITSETTIEESVLHHLMGM